MIHFTKLNFTGKYVVKGYPLYYDYLQDYIYPLHACFFTELVWEDYPDIIGLNKYLGKCSNLKELKALINLDHYDPYDKGIIYARFNCTRKSSKVQKIVDLKKSGALEDLYYLV